jgi:Rubredoxin-like zinc ribbon domain (DUF35_N)
MSSSDARPVSAGVKVCKCGGCGALYFPARLICFRCGGGDWSDVRICDGTIDESTRIPTGANGSTDTFLATVNASGLRIIAALETPLPDGTGVMLEERNGAPWAVPADAR